jgi:hypothetical protein
MLYVYARQHMQAIYLFCMISMVSSCSSAIFMFIIYNDLFSFLEVVLSWQFHHSPVQFSCLYLIDSIIHRSSIKLAVSSCSCTFFLRKFYFYILHGSSIKLAVLSCSLAFFYLIGSILNFQRRGCKRKLAAAVKCLKWHLKSS